MSDSPSSNVPSSSPDLRDALRYRAFVRQDAVGIAETDAAGRLHFVNRKLCEITGYAETELLQMRFQDLTHPDDLIPNLAYWEQFIATGKPFGFEKRYVRKDGQPIWVHVSVSVIHPGEPADLVVLTTVLDVTERRRAEESARQLAARYLALFNSIHAGFCVVEVQFDPGGRAVDYVFLEVNSRFPSVAGFNAVPGARMRDVAPAHEEYWFEIFGRVAATGIPVSFEQEAQAVRRYFRVNAFRVGGAASRQVGILFEDVTAARSSQRQRTFLTELSERVAGLRSEDDIVRETVHAVGTFIGAARCYFAEILEAENRVRISEDYAQGGLDPMPRGLSLFDFGAREWWQKMARGGFSAADVAENPLTRPWAEKYASIGVRSYCALPFREHSPWTVLICATDTQPRNWSDDELKLLDHVIARVWPLIERARQERALSVERETLEQRVLERTAKLQETVAELETYSYSISHDLRAPLRAIQSYASIVTSEGAEQLTPDGREYLRRIIIAAERMDRLIRDVLVYSRVARQDLPLERIELGSFIASIVESYPNFRGAAAVIEIAAPLDAVNASPAALTQCVANLLENAIKFAAPGVKPHVRVWSETAGDRVRLFFRDNGIGIDPAQVEKIFGVFYQAGPRDAGTGIGLAVVKKAAERMGGAVSVASQPGEGSTFCLELQRAGA